MPGFSPTEFMNNIERRGGLSRRWKYSVQITPPTLMSSRIGTGIIDFFALAVSMPAKSFAETEQRIYGINKAVPYETTFEPITLTMLNPNDWSTRKFWDEWLDYIQNPGSKDMKYYKDMIGRIEISHYDDTITEINPNNARYTVVLEEAWPKSISAYDMGWENTEFGTVELSIQYKQWHQKGTTRHVRGASPRLRRRRSAFFPRRP